MSEWKTYKLGDLVTFQRGHDLTKSQMQEGIFPVAGSNGVIGFHNEYTTKAPSITIGRSGNIGNAYFFDKDFWAHNTTLYIKEFKNCDPKFIYYLLQTMNFGGHNSGSAVPSLNRNYIHPIEVQAPDLPTQKEIAQILSSLDDKIELNLQMNQTLEAMAQAIFKEWFVNFNFPGFDGELVDGLPKGWRMGNLGDEFNLIMGQSPPGTSYNEIGEGMVFYQGRTDFGFRFPTNRLYTTEPKRIAKPLDTLVSVRAPVGDINMANEMCCVGRGLSSVRHKSDAYSFTYYMMKNLEPVFNGFEGEGTVFGSINKSNFESIEIIVPSNEIIYEFEPVVNPLDDKILENTKQIQSLTQTRDTLLPKLMSGQLEIS